MTAETKNKLALGGLPAAFMLLQLTLLWLGNRAGADWLAPERQELVYYAEQVFVLLGFFLYALTHRWGGAGLREGITPAALVLLLAGAAALLYAGPGGFRLLAVVPATLGLGLTGGAVNARMAAAMARGERAARAMGIGYALAVALQYPLQIWKGPSPLLGPVMLLAGAALFLALGRLPCELSPPEGTASPVSRRRLLHLLCIAAALLLFTSFYNGYIHRLQVRSGYGAYNVYSWPRLLLIPAYLFFASIGDRREGRFVPLAALCIATAALLNSVLTDAYRLNMCLFYLAISATVAYYQLCFWRAAPRTRWGGLWASLGRMLDSGMVLLTGLLRLSALPAAAVLSLDVAVLAAAILLMALNGDFNLASSPSPAPRETLPDPRPDPLGQLSERCGLTPAETRVLRELVQTEDKQEALAARLGMSVNTLRHHITALYRKTGAETRAGLVRLVRDGG